MFGGFGPSGDWVVLGLMSGTSLDGLDAARLRFTREGGQLKDWKLLEHRHRPFDPRLRAELEALIRGEARNVASLARLHVDFSRTCAEFILAEFPPLTGKLRAHLAAFPGQTLWHEPEGGLSFQIGSPAAFAVLTGIPTVGEFRLPDILLGGQGAPLVPLADALLFRDPNEYRALLNLGGIANVTLLPPGRGVQGVIGWDAGPGNTLLDQAARLALGKACDQDGRMAARGRIDEQRLARWLSHPWFAQEAPKSTGRELFGGTFLGPAAMAEELAALGAEDLLATLTELTVTPIVEALSRRPVQRLFICGGGAGNATLMKRLAERLAPLPIESSAVLGMPPQAREAACFALLALEAASGRPVALPEVTGARRAGTAGLFSPGQGADE